MLVFAILVAIAFYDPNQEIRLSFIGSFQLKYIALFYVLVMILRAFGFDNMPFLHEGSVLGIGFSLFVVTIASLNLILDFDMIEKGAEMGAPKYMEWYGAFGLMVTMVWLYLEILRLLSKISSRN